MVPCAVTGLMEMRRRNTAKAGRRCGLVNEMEGLRPPGPARAKNAIVLDAGGFFDWIVSNMKTKIFAAYAVLGAMCHGLFLYCDRHK